MSEKKPGFFKRVFGLGKKPIQEHLASDQDQTHLEPGPPKPARSGLNIPPIPGRTLRPYWQHRKSPMWNITPMFPGPPEATIAPELAEEDDELEVEDLSRGASSPELERLDDALPLAERETMPQDDAGIMEAPSDAEAVIPHAEISTPLGKNGGWFKRLATGLKRTSDQLSTNIGAVFTKTKLDEGTLEDLEDVLIQADLGIDTAMAITQALAKSKFDKEISAQDVRAVLAEEVEKVLEPVAVEFEIDPDKKPFVILMIGVNGSGKTTTIGKLSEKFSEEGHKVLLAAGDTFRAAAIEQLQVWGQRTNSPVVSRPAGSDASGLAYDAVKQAQDDDTDVLIIDTAGRLQNRDELMAELEKIIRVIKKVDESAPHAVLLTLDATTGQNALQQVEIFSKRAGVTGLVMTKLDGTARGGILVAIAKKYALPVHYIGVGEGVDDLESFVPGEFAAIIAGNTDDNFFDLEDEHV